MLAYYYTYDFLRSRVAVAGAARPFHHALDLVDAERFLGMYHERTIQQWLLPARGLMRGFIEFWNVYYGTIHFVVPALVFVWLYRRLPDRYPRWRNAWFAMNALALVSFALWPLTPPRLMSAHFGFVDTAATIGCPLMCSSAGHSAKEFGNLYAAMPSLHLGWSTWAALAVWRLTPRWWVRALATLYPLVTLFDVVVTANHWILDGAGGVVFLGLGFAVSAPLTRWARDRATTRPRAPAV